MIIVQQTELPVSLLTSREGLFHLFSINHVVIQLHVLNTKHVLKYIPELGQKVPPLTFLSIAAVLGKVPCLVKTNVGLQ